MFRLKFITIPAISTGYKAEYYKYHFSAQKLENFSSRKVFRFDHSYRILNYGRRLVVSHKLLGKRDFKLL